MITDSVISLRLTETARLIKPCRLFPSAAESDDLDGHQCLWTDSVQALPDPVGQCAQVGDGGVVVVDGVYAGSSDGSSLH